MSRAGTKQADLLALLSRARGATIREMTEGTGWRANTVHSALVTLRKRGWQISVEKTAAERRYQITESPASTPSLDDVRAGA